jgi:SAM-dependent methyltransferase
VSPLIRAGEMSAEPRPELARIEAALRQHPAVEGAAVIDVGGSRRVAFVTPAAGWTVASRRGADASALLKQRQLELWPSHGEYPIYGELLYYAMVEDEARNLRYRRALSAAAPGRVVLDVGTGAEAVLARFALEAGASRVYAIERSPTAYEAARRLLRRLRLEGRIHLLFGEATELAPRERVDVVVSELIGTIGGSEGAAVALNEVRRRWLKPGGAMVPRRCRTSIAGVSLPEETLRRPRFGRTAGYFAEKVLEVIGEGAELRVCAANLPPSWLLSDAGLFEDLDFAAEVPTAHQRELRLRLARSGRLAGFLAWIELEPEPGDAVSALRDDCSWLPLLLPVWPDGLDVEEGDEVAASVGSALSQDGQHPDYWLRGTVRRRGREEVGFSFLSPYRGPTAPGSLTERLVEGMRREEWAEPERRLTLQSLQSFLAAALPGPPLPSECVALAELPAGDGEVDRRALAALAPPPPRRGGRLDGR